MCSCVTCDTGVQFKLEKPTEAMLAAWKNPRKAKKVNDKSKLEQLNGDDAADDASDSSGSSEDEADAATHKKTEKAAKAAPEPDSDEDF